MNNENIIVNKKSNPNNKTKKLAGEFSPQGDSVFITPSHLFLKQAKVINNCNFYLCGYGWFNVSTKEFAYILELASKEISKG